MTDWTFGFRSLSLYGACLVLPMGLFGTAFLMMASLHGNAFRIIEPLWGHQTGQNYTALLNSLLIAWPKNQTNGAKFGYLRRHWNIFRVTGPSWGESTGHRWVPLTRASDKELWYFFLFAWTNGWANNRDALDLRRHRTDSDVIVVSMRVSVLLWHYIYIYRQHNKFRQCTWYNSPCQTIHQTISKTVFPTTALDWIWVLCQ